MELTPGEIALAEAILALAQAKYETLKDGVDPAEVALAEANLADAQAKLELAQRRSSSDRLNCPDGWHDHVDRCQRW